MYYTGCMYVQGSDMFWQVLRTPLHLIPFRCAAPRGQCRPQVIEAHCIYTGKFLIASVHQWDSLSECLVSLILQTIKTGWFYEKAVAHTPTNNQVLIMLCFVL